MNRLLLTLVLFVIPLAAKADSFKYALHTTDARNTAYRMMIYRIVFLPENASKQICEQTVWGNKDYPQKIKLECLNELPAPFSGVLTRNQLPELYYVVHSQKTDYMVVDLISIYKLMDSFPDKEQVCAHLLSWHADSHTKPQCFAPLQVANNSLAFQIEDVAVGLASFKNQTIYLKTDSVRYEENGLCTMAGQQRKCLAWALSVKYAGAGKDTELICNSTSTQPYTKVDIYSKDSGKINTDTISIKLPSGNGTMFLPAYFIKDEDDSGIFKTEFRCSIQDRVVFTKSFSVNFDR